jgi:transaldolase
MSMNPAQKILTCGQSIWYDNISRNLITSGELRKLLNEWGVRGITSNPSIFDAALKKGDSYDGQILSLKQSSLDTENLFNELALQDIAWAADMLLPVYRESEGVDGFVSLEVSPLLARDSEGTVKQARELFSRLNRPNIMIKIPGTPECIPAIRTCLEEGININVTLLFSVDNYVSVARTYCEALNSRLASGKAVDRVRSVASFFVSRVDSIVDSALDEIGKSNPEALEHKGKFGIANCKLAYEQFEKIFTGEEFSNLKKAGAKVQRPLWASTSTKNPAYRDTLYIEELVGPETVNTVPHATLEATVDHGKIRENAIRENPDEAKAVKETLSGLGVDLEALMEELQVDGVKKFAESFDSLLASVSSRKEMLS